MELSTLARVNALSPSLSLSLSNRQLCTFIFITDIVIGIRKMFQKMCPKTTYTRRITLVIHVALEKP